MNYFFLVRITVTKKREADLAISRLPDFLNHKSMEKTYNIAKLKVSPG